MDVVEHIEISVTKAQDKAKDPFSVTSFGFNIYQNKCFREEEFLTLEQYQTCVWGILAACSELFGETCWGVVFWCETCVALIRFNQAVN